MARRLGFGNIRKMINTSGVLYKEMKLAQKPDTMREAGVLGLLAKHGKLVKRPFVLTRSEGLVGFKEDEWKKILK